MQVLEEIPEKGSQADLVELLDDSEALELYPEESKQLPLITSALFMLCDSNAFLLAERFRIQIYIAQ